MAQTRDGGKPNVKPRPYSPPQGPTSLMHNGPGLGGDNHGTGMRGETHETKADMRREHTGKPGIGGKNHGNLGSQRCD